MHLISAGILRNVQRTTIWQDRKLSQTCILRWILLSSSIRDLSAYTTSSKLSRLYILAKLFTKVLQDGWFSFLSGNRETRLCRTEWLLPTKRTTNEKPNAHEQVARGLLNTYVTDNAIMESDDIITISKQTSGMPVVTDPEILWCKLSLCRSV